MSCVSLGCSVQRRRRSTRRTPRKWRRAHVQRLKRRERSFDALRNIRIVLRSVVAPGPGRSAAPLTGRLVVAGMQKTDARRRFRVVPPGTGCRSIPCQSRGCRAPAPRSWSTYLRRTVAREGALLPVVRSKEAELVALAAGTPRIRKTDVAVVGAARVVADASGQERPGRPAPDRRRRSRPISGQARGQRVQVVLEIADECGQVPPPQVDALVQSCCRRCRRSSVGPRRGVRWRAIVRQPLRVAAGTRERPIRAAVAEAVARRGRRAHACRARAARPDATERARLSRCRR